MTTVTNGKKAKPNATVQRALEKGMAPRAEADDNGARFKFTAAQLKKLKELISTMELAKTTVVNVAVRYGLRHAVAFAPEKITEVNGFPKRLGKTELVDALTLDTRHLLERYGASDHYREFAVLGVDLLHKNLEIDKIKKATPTN